MNIKELKKIHKTYETSTTYILILYRKVSRNNKKETILELNPSKFVH